MEGQLNVKVNFQAKGDFEAVKREAKDTAKYLDGLQRPQQDYSILGRRYHRFSATPPEHPSVLKTPRFVERQNEDLSNIFRATRGNAVMGGISHSDREFARGVGKQSSMLHSLYGMYRELATPKIPPYYATPIHPKEDVPFPEATTEAFNRRTSGGTGVGEEPKKVTPSKKPPEPFQGPYLKKDSVRFYYGGDPNAEKDQVTPEFTKAEKLARRAGKGSGLFYVDIDKNDPFLKDKKEWDEQERPDLGPAPYKDFQLDTKRKQMMREYSKWRVEADTGKPAPWGTDILGGESPPTKETMPSPPSFHRPEPKKEKELSLWQMWKNLFGEQEEDREEEDAKQRKLQREKKPSRLETPSSLKKPKSVTGDEGGGVSSSSTTVDKEGREEEDAKQRKLQREKELSRPETAVPLKKPKNIEPSTVVMGGAPSSSTTVDKEDKEKEDANRKDLKKEKESFRPEATPPLKKPKNAEPSTVVGGGGGGGGGGVPPPPSIVVGEDDWEDDDDSSKSRKKHYGGHGPNGRPFRRLRAAIRFGNMGGVAGMSMLASGAMGGPLGFVSGLGAQGAYAGEAFGKTPGAAAGALLGITIGAVSKGFERLIETTTNLGKAQTELIEMFPRLAHNMEAISLRLGRGERIGASEFFATVPSGVSAATIARRRYDAAHFRATSPISGMFYTERRERMEEALLTGSPGPGFRIMNVPMEERRTVMARELEIAESEHRMRIAGTHPEGPYRSLAEQAEKEAMIATLRRGATIGIPGITRPDFPGTPKFGDAKSIRDFLLLEAAGRAPEERATLELTEELRRLRAFLEMRESGDRFGMIREWLEHGPPPGFE